MLKNEDFNFVIDVLAEEVSLKVYEDTFEIRFDFAALYVIYKSFGFNPAIESVGPDPMRWAGVLWAGLLRCSPEIEPKTVFEWFSAATALRLIEGTATALRMSLPAPRAEDQPAGPLSA